MSGPTANENLKMHPPQSGVRVRMYRSGGLGDCFLLAFPAADGSPTDVRYMLIDFGVLIGPHRMPEVADDIYRATGGLLDVLVVTHEHYDHVSGFHLAWEEFDRLEVKEGWMSWLEEWLEEEGQQNKKLTKTAQKAILKQMLDEKQRALQALISSAQAIRATAFQLGAGEDESVPGLESLLDFYGLRTVYSGKGALPGATVTMRLNSRSGEIVGQTGADENGEWELLVVMDPRVFCYVLTGNGKAGEEEVAKSASSQAIKLYLNGVSIGSTAAKASGEWQFTYTLPDSLSSDGGQFLGVSKAEFKNSLKIHGSTGAAMRYVRDKVPERDNRYYLEPGKQRELAEIPGVRFYVLGPPTDKTELYKLDPKGDEGYSFGHTLALNESNAFYSALGLSAIDEDRQDLLERNFPFDEAYKINFKDLQKASQEGDSTAKRKVMPYDRFFGDNYFQADANRRIDMDWIVPLAEQLALKVDNIVNNTSLAMAIELKKSKKVLLFPGDAQIGSWKSWHDVTFDDPLPGDATNGGDTPIKGETLLKRAVFYKVGHHGSHNATLRTGGLEIMGTDMAVTGGELVAMIPVYQEQARLKKKWCMPLPKLLERLKEKTQDRVMRADTDLSALFVELESSAALSAAELAEFKQRAREDQSNNKLWIEFDVLDE